MTKQEILEYFKDINFAYNECTRYDSLSMMLDELMEVDEGKISVNRTHELMENELRCVQTASTNRCDRNCGKCPLVVDDEEIIAAYGLVIKLLERYIC